MSILRWSVPAHRRNAPADRARPGHCDAFRRGTKLLGRLLRRLDFTSPLGVRAHACQMRGPGPPAGGSRGKVGTCSEPASGSGSGHALMWHSGPVINNWLRCDDQAPSNGPRAAAVRARCAPRHRASASGRSPSTGGSHFRHWARRRRRCGIGQPTRKLGLHASRCYTGAARRAGDHRTPRMCRSQHPERKRRWIQDWPSVCPSSSVCRIDDQGVPESPQYSSTFGCEGVTVLHDFGATAEPESRRPWQRSDQRHMANVDAADSTKRP
jgi:hypothetical protein